MKTKDVEMNIKKTYTKHKLLSTWLIISWMETHELLGPSVEEKQVS